MSVTKRFSSLSKLYTNYEKVPEIFLDVGSFFTIISRPLPWSIIQLFELAKVPTKNFLLANYFSFQFCNLKNQQMFILEEEVSVSLKELAAFLNTLRQLSKQYDKAVRFAALHLLPKPKQEIGFTLYKNKLFA